MEALKSVIGKKRTLETKEEKSQSYSFKVRLIVDGKAEFVNNGQSLEEAADNAAFDALSFLRDFEGKEVIVQEPGIIFFCSNSGSTDSLNLWSLLNFVNMDMIVSDDNEREDVATILGSVGFHSKSHKTNNSFTLVSNLTVGTKIIGESWSDLCLVIGHSMRRIKKNDIPIYIISDNSKHVDEIQRNLDCENVKIYHFYNLDNFYASFLCEQTIDQ